MDMILQALKPLTTTMPSNQRQESPDDEMEQSSKNTSETPRRFPKSTIETTETLIIPNNNVVGSKTKSSSLHLKDMAKLMKFGTYDGTRDATKLLGWLRPFDTYYKRCPLQEADKVQFALCHLEGKAGLWWEVKESQGVEINTWDKLKVLIKK